MSAPIDRKAPRRGARLVLFNHKGGVGKTMLTANIACALAEIGKSVLIVDSDPQCNISSFFMENEVIDTLLDNSDTPTGRTLWTAVRSIVDGSGDVARVAPWNVRDNVDLLPGDIRLAEFEEALTGLWSECFQRRNRGFRGSTAISALVGSLAHDSRYDFIIYDCGPNIGALNRVVLLDADYFIVPAACDLFSLRAIKTLGHTLASWIADWQVIAELAPQETTTLPGFPSLMGYIPQRFRTYSRSAAEAQAGYISRIDAAITRDVVAVLGEISPDLVRLKPTKIGEVKDFSTLASKSQSEGKPFWEIASASPTQRGEARNVFIQLAGEICRRSEL